MRFPSVALLVVLLPAGAPLALAGATPEECLACHSDSSLSMERRGKPVSLFVDGARLAASTHAGLDCLACHEGFDAGGIPHRAKIPPVDCLACHADAPDKHPFHAAMRGAPGTNGPESLSCKGCHGTHEVRKLADPASRFHRSRLTASCGECHRDVADAFTASEHGKAVAGKVQGAPDCLHCHEQPLTAARWEGDEATLKQAQEKMCLSCHLDDPAVRARMAPTAGFIAAYEKSVHGAALHRGDGRAANCVDCHGSHEMGHGTDPAARVSKAHIPETCARCHPAAAELYARSVHAAAVKRAVANAPVCTDCHGEHDILAPSDPRSRVAAANVSAEVCSPCHSSLRLSQKYGIASDRFRTFTDSYHGLALKGGSLEVANCASCHGAHDIRSSRDPASSIHKANLAATCGRCHPGANERFAVGPVHVLTAGPRKPEEPILYWISMAYVSLIAAVVGGMGLHNLLDFVKRARRRIRVRRREESAEEAGSATHLRMTAGERWQHGALALSFIVLVFTGFMLRYPDAGWVRWIRAVVPHAFEWRSLAHRVAAVVMVLAGLVHLHYAAFTARGRRFVRDIFPVREDVYDLIGTVLHNLGIRRDRPRFGRFSYIEKSEYWAVVWGTLLMTLTGVVLWFENRSIGLLTKLGWDVARTIHFYEAWLAFLSILVWHFYFVFFNPDVYPMSTTWLTGTLTESEMAEEHPKELEEIRRQEEEARRAREPGAALESDATEEAPGAEEAEEAR
jgi:cytochrome b subunit of formate dehydrogenase